MANGYPFFTLINHAHDLFSSTALRRGALLLALMNMSCSVLHERGAQFRVFTYKQTNEICCQSIRSFCFFTALPPKGPSSPPAFQASSLRFGLGLGFGFGSRFELTEAAATMSLTSVCYCYMTTDVRDEMHALSMFPRVMQPKVFVNRYESVPMCVAIS
jgi:hypothetical protein